MSDTEKKLDDLTVKVMELLIDRWIIRSSPVKVYDTKTGQAREFKLGEVYETH